MNLVASHTKPWRDSTNDERLDCENGLLLTLTIDHLFASRP
jgi:putative restriction endonuclease